MRFAPRFLQTCSGALLIAATILAQDTPVYRDASKPINVRANDLLARLSLDEKIGLIHANSKFSTQGVPRLGVPPLWMSDGPHGVREEIGPDTWNPAGRTDDFSTAMPAGICLAATWNTELGFADGKSTGQEALVRGKNIMLGPGVNIMRTPLNGRNFEYLGEDPYLAGQIAVGFINGEQAQGIAACVKHFAGNNQEIQRNSINVEMDERTLHEIYLPAFKAAVKEGHVWSVMGAYNRFRGTYCCENAELLKRILKEDWAFEGLVMSDWGGAHTTQGSVLGGLDLEMGTNGPYQNNYLATPFADGIKKGTYTMAQLDDKVVRVLRVMIATHLLDQRPVGSINTKEHQTTARRVAEEGMVLLKNQGGNLPFDATKISSVAVIGSNATQKFAYGGQSSGIKAFYEVTPLEGIVKELGDKITITYAPGYRIPRRPRRGQTAQPATAEDSRLIDQAVAAAKRSDVVIVIAGLNHDFDTEGSDRSDMKLPGGQDELIAKVAAANPRTAVVLVAGSPVEMGSWLGKAPSVIQSWFGGMEGGNAIARVLFGDVNPSGKLPCSIPKKLEDSPTSAFKSYPGANGVEKYEEGLLVGYRWYETKKIEPQFPFGFGLSYTKFEYSNLKCSSDLSAQVGRTVVQFDITNTGARDGSEIAQLYIAPQTPSVSRPPKELKGFRKVSISASGKETVTLTLDPSSFAYYDPSKEAWVAEKGAYEIQIGASSQDIRLRQKIELPATMVIKD